MKNPALPVGHILEAIENIEQDSKDVRFEDFKKNRRTHQLIERNLEIISEASRRLPDTIKMDYPDIPWKEIAGIGNILRHDYHHVLADVLWETLDKRLVPLKKAVKSIEAQLKKQSRDPS